MNKYAKGALIVGGIGAGAYALVLTGRAVNTMLRNMQMQNAVQMQGFVAQQQQQYGRNQTQYDAGYWTTFAVNLANSLYSFGSRIYGDFFSGGEDASSGNMSDYSGNEYRPTEQNMGGTTYDWGL